MKDSLIEADKLAKQGKNAYQREEYLIAGEFFQNAGDLYHSVEDILTAAEMYNNASVAYLQAGDALKAFDMANGTPELFAAANDTARQGMAWGNLGSALDALDRLDEAAAAYSESADLLQVAGEMEARLRVMQALSALQLRTGKRLQALATMQAGLDDIQKPNLKQKALKKLLKMPFDLLGKSG